MAIAEQAGVTAQTMVCFVCCIYRCDICLDWLFIKNVRVDAYYLAGRQVPTVFNGMATADWMSGASFSLSWWCLLWWL